MASALKLHYQRINSVAVISATTSPSPCAITAFATDLNEDQSAQARAMKTWDAAINDKYEVHLSA